MILTSIPVEFIESTSVLHKLCKELSKINTFSFDTEFDRFHREYGFKLSLLQIFDGNRCYIIDPIAIKDLSALWPVFEDDSITKVAYSCSEDVQILKVNGCQPRNIFDVQIAAKLCNSSTNSYAELLREELGIELDKSMQRSDWRKRPLKKEQLIYASNDVTPLLQLKEIFEQRAIERGVSKFIEEDCRDCESIEVSKFSVKLSANQKRTYSQDEQKKMYAMMLVRNEIAKKYNIPPASVFTDSVLETLITSKLAMVNFPPKGFCNRLKNDDPNLEIIEAAMEVSADNLPEVPVVKSKNRFEALKNAEHKQKPDEGKLEVLKNYMAEKYGAVAADHILRGFKKSLTSAQGMDLLKTYQQENINEAIAQLNLKF